MQNKEHISREGREAWMHWRTRPDKQITTELHTLLAASCMHLLRMCLKYIVHNSQTMQVLVRNYIGGHVGVKLRCDGSSLIGAHIIS
jgi:hypothetical protein